MVVRSLLRYHNLWLQLIEYPLLIKKYQQSSNRLIPPHFISPKNGERDRYFFSLCLERWVLILFDNIYRMIKLINNIGIFSTNFYSVRKLFASKAPKQTGIIKVSVKKIDQALNGQLIYNTNKTKQFLIMSGVMSLGLALTVYVFQKQPTFVNLIPLLVTCCAAGFYQKRVFNTVRQIIVQKSGQKINVIKYGLFGSELFSQTVRVPIHIMSGMARKPINKGIAIRGGGRFGIKSFSYYFHEAGVVDKHVFNSVISGKQIQYTDLI